MLCKGVEVKERTFENNRKNVIKRKNRKMSRIKVEIGVLTINDFIQTWKRKHEKEICCENNSELDSCGRRRLRICVYSILMNGNEIVGSTFGMELYVVCIVPLRCKQVE